MASRLSEGGGVAASTGLSAGVSARLLEIHQVSLTVIADYTSERYISGQWPRPLCVQESLVKDSQ